MELLVNIQVDVAEAVRRGKPAPRQTTLTLDEGELSALSEGDRAMLADHLQDLPRDGLTLADPVSLDRLTVPEPTLAGALEAVRTAAARAAAREAAAAEVVASLDLAEVGRYKGAENTSLRTAIVAFAHCAGEVADVAETMLSDGQRAVIQAACDEAAAARHAAQEAQREAEGAQREAERAAEEARREAERQERDTWIAEHGSDRLRRCVAEGIECDAIYRDERLALELPGWEWADWWRREEPRNPSVEALDLLDRARQSRPDAVLCYVTECRSDPDAPEFEEDWHGYRAYAEFLGRPVTLSEQVRVP